MNTALQISCLVSLFLSGCAAPSKVIMPPKETGAGVYHRVEKGQTLWRISKIYGIELDELARINRIPDTTSIETGQLIFIPRPKVQAPAAQALSLPEDFIWPVKGKVISTFGQLSAGIINKGIDILPPQGAKVLASRSGKVVFYNRDFKGYGQTVVIDHGDGYLTVYAVNSEVLISPGDSLLRGQPIARTRAGSPVHFEIRKGHSPQNPSFYLP